MADVRETRLPGVGVRHDFVTSDGTPMAVLVQRDGKRQILVYDRRDRDACTGLLSLSLADAQTMSELLGASHVTEAVTAVQQQIEGLAIEWIDLGSTSPMIGRTIGDGAFRTKTGCSVVAVIRGDDSVPAPGPEFRFERGDVAVAVGTRQGLDSLRELIRT